MVGKHYVIIVLLANFIGLSTLQNVALAFDAQYEMTLVEENSGKNENLSHDLESFMGFVKKEFLSNQLILNQKKNNTFSSYVTGYIASSCNLLLEIPPENKI